MKKRILLKLSGGALKDENNGNIFDLQKLSELADQIQILHKTHDIGIVIGGGNIWRGIMNKNNTLSKSDSDYIGMLSTVINGLALKNVLLSRNLETELYSALHVEKITKILSIEKINKSLLANKVVIFAGGTGHPYFTTDTGAAMRAIDMHADCILMAKDKVCGVYSDDPKKNKDAKFLSELSYDDVLNMNLKVMDLTALTLCKENCIELLVFNINEENSIINTINNKSKHTRISKQGKGK